MQTRLQHAYARRQTGFAAASSGTLSAACRFSLSVLRLFTTEASLCPAIVPQAPSAANAAQPAVRSIVCCMAVWLKALLPGVACSMMGLL